MNAQMESAVVGLGLAGTWQDEIVTKALENQRLMSMKVNNLNRAESARTALAIEFACKSLRIPVPPRTSFLKLAGGLSQKDYVDAFQKCIKLMDLKFENLNTIDVFAVKYGSSDTASDAKMLLEAFKRQQAKLSKYHHTPDYGSALYQGAAFIVAAKTNKLKVVPKRDAFFESLDLPNKNLFNSVCVELEAIPHDHLKSFEDKEHMSISTGDQQLSGSSSWHAPAPQPLTSATGLDSQQTMKRDIMQSSQPIVEGDLISQSMTAKESDEFNRLKNSQFGTKRLHSNVQFDNVKSAQIREAAEKEAVERKRKNLALYTMWKKSVLQKRSISSSSTAS